MNAITFSPSFFQEASASVDLSYRVGDKTGHLTDLSNLPLRPSAPFSNETVQVRTSVEQAEGHMLLSIRIKALQTIELQHFEAKYNVNLDGQRMLANGFQSWSQTRELQREDRILDIRLGWLTQNNLQGDYDFFPYTGEKGVIHSNSYTHFRDVKNQMHFLGSLSENLGYTYFKGNFNTNTLGIYKDVEGKRLDAGQEVELIKVFIAGGDEDELWDLYSTFFPDRRALRGDSSALLHVTGWTSWYNYYGDVTEKIIVENLEALKGRYPINIFQIDDGYQTAIGDWLSLNSKFPSGMPSTVTKIKEAGFLAGLWLAPFAVGFTSQVAIEHVDWLIQDPLTGKPVVAGPNWGGFYALDMYHADARAYLSRVFQVVLHEWGFDILKLDFCFAAAMRPRLGKSRGEIMWDAMEFIRDIVGPDKLILGCGLPLATAWRKVDYCRIGSDVAPWWEDTKLKLLNVRERVSTYNSLISTLTRWAASDRMFGNDPDAVILRTKNNKLKPEEQFTLCVLNNILGSLVFISDNVSEYDANQHRLYAATFPKAQCNVKSVVEFRQDVFVIRFKTDGYLYTTITNVSYAPQTVYCPESSDDTQILFMVSKNLHMTGPGSNSPLFYNPSSTVTLEKHETVTFLHIPPQTVAKKTFFLGSTNHIVPGAEIARLEEKESGEFDLEFRKENKGSRSVYLGSGVLHDDSLSVTPMKVNQCQTRIEYVPVCGNGEGRVPGTLCVHVYEDCI